MTAYPYRDTFAIVILRVREWRERRGLSYRELARRTGVALSTLYRIESGAASPTIAMLERLAAALSVTVGDFLPDDQIPKRRRGR